MLPLLYLPHGSKAKEAKDKAQKQGQDFKDGYWANEDITDKNRVANKYISPSDNIMSPCTQKLSALRGKQFGKFVSRLSFFSFVFLSSSLLQPVFCVRSISFSDGCAAKTGDFHSNRAKPKSLFAQTAGKNVGVTGGDEDSNPFAGSAEQGGKDAA